MDLKELIENTEKVSKNYAEKFDIKRDKDWLFLQLQEELGELTQKYLIMTERSRKKEINKIKIKKEFENEVADVFGIVLLLIKHFDVNIEKAMDEKWFKYLEK